MTELTGAFQYEDGSPVTGYAILDLIAGGQYVIVGTPKKASTGEDVTPRYKVTIINSTITSVTGLDGTAFPNNSIVGNDDISPPDTLYRYRLYDNLGRELSSLLDIEIESATYDLSSSVPTQPTVFFFKPGITSLPPTGKHKVSNLYVDNGKFTVEYDDTPA